MIQDSPSALVPLGKDAVQSSPPAKRRLSRFVKFIRFSGFASLIALGGDALIDRYFGNANQVSTDVECSVTHLDATKQKQVTSTFRNGFVYTIRSTYEDCANLLAQTKPEYFISFAFSQQAFHPKLSGIHDKAEPYFASRDEVITNRTQALQASKILVQYGQAAAVQMGAYPLSLDNLEYRGRIWGQSQKELARVKYNKTLDSLKL